MTCSDQYASLLQTFHLAYWPAPTSKLSYQLISPKKLLKLGFKCSALRQLQCVSCAQTAMLPPELMKGCMVPYSATAKDESNASSDVESQLKRFALRLQNSTHLMSCPHNQPEYAARHMIQKEVDMASELKVDGEFSIKTKKLLIMRGKELVEAIQESYE